MFKVGDYVKDAEFDGLKSKVIRVRKDHLITLECVPNGFKIRYKRSEFKYLINL